MVQVKSDHKKVSIFPNSTHKVLKKAKKLAKSLQDFPLVKYDPLHCKDTLSNRVKVGPN